MTRFGRHKLRAALSSIRRIRGQLYALSLERLSDPQRCLVEAELASVQAQEKRIRALVAGAA
jgi:hypothetical protein